jgi:hypothetical protein
MTILMLALGLAAHYLKELVRMTGETGKKPAPLRYWTLYWPQTLLCAISAAAGFIALQEAGELTAVTAFGVGYMANSIADVIGKRTTVHP